MSHLSTEDFEALNRTLCDEKALREYKEPLDAYHVSLLPRLLGKWLVFAGNIVYGNEPSYLKFRAVEVIARVPYHSWTSAVHTLLTLFYTDERRALSLIRTADFARYSQDNETMHVVVVSHFAKNEGHAGFMRYTLIPMLFAFAYFWWSYLLFLLNPRYSYELNYMFESHAFEQYNEFIRTKHDELCRKPASSQYLEWYGRHHHSQYDFFLAVRNDELIHRNASIHAIQ